MLSYFHSLFRFSWSCTMKALYWDWYYTETEWKIERLLFSASRACTQSYEPSFHAESIFSPLCMEAMFSITRLCGKWSAALRNLLPCYRHWTLSNNPGLEVHIEPVHNVKNVKTTSSRSYNVVWTLSEDYLWRFDTENSLKDCMAVLSSLLFPNTST